MRCRAMVVLALALFGCSVVVGSAEPGAEPGEVAIDTSRESVPHPIAQRSPFPGIDETITELIPAVRLSGADPFAPHAEGLADQEVVPWDEARNYMGKEIVVEGKIVDTGQTGNGRVSFLNFDKDWRGKFCLVMFDDLTRTLPKGVDETFRGKTLRVRGVVSEHRGAPQIKVMSMDQVEFVGE